MSSEGQIRELIAKQTERMRALRLSRPEDFAELRIRHEFLSDLDLLLRGLDAAVLKPPRRKRTKK